MASLWAGMGAVYQLTITPNLAGAPAGPALKIVAKRVELPRVCDNIGDQVSVMMTSY